MKKTVLLLLTMMAFLGYTQAQEGPLPDTLVITEVYVGGHPGNAFLEFTNMGQSTVDLSKYFLTQCTNGGVFGPFIRLSGSLEPGGTFLIVGNRKFRDMSSPDIRDSIDTTPAYYRTGPYDLMLPNFNDGTTFAPGADALRMWEGDDAAAIVFDADGDGVMNLALGDKVVDQVGLLGVQGGARYVYPDVAGVTDATINHILIRKYSVKLPNYGNFPAGLGVSAEDSDWIVVPFYPIRTGHFFKTIKNHGNTFPWMVSSSTVTIEENRIVVPWGIRRDSLYQEFNFGDNMAWYLRWGADTAYSVVTQTADTFYMYLAGNEVTTRIYPVTVSPPADNMNRVFPAFARNAVGSLFLSYTVTDDFVIDTIANIPFGTRVDTLLTYLEKAPAANWHIGFEGGVARADLKTGDKLVVTAANNDVREYYLELNDYNPSSNAHLGAIYLYGDTIWGFRRNVLSYTEYLSPDTDFPAITAKPENLNARVHVERPKNIRGGREDRTARIHVMAPDDSTELTYTVTFEIMRMTESFHADPIFSKFIWGAGWNKGYDIFNPGNTVIPLSDYILGWAGASSVQSVVSSTQVMNKIRPGYAIDSARMAVGIYFNEKAYPFLVDMEPGRSLFFARGSASTAIPSPPFAASPGFRPYVDFADANNNAAFQYQTYGFADGASIARLLTAGTSVYLIRIDNDSIFNGTKSAGDANDYTLVDIYGAQGINNTQTIEGVSYTLNDNITFVRKPHIWQGNPENHGSFGIADSLGSSEWIKHQAINVLLGTHEYDPYTGFISTVTSPVYKVSFDYGPSESIRLVPPGTNVNTFLSNIYPDGEDAELTVTNAAGDVVKTGDDLMTDGDKLTVISATGENSTVYTITLEVPSSNAVLTSTVYTVNIGAEGGQVSGIPALTTIEDMLSNITVPAGATLTVIDIMNQQVGTEKVLFDTLYIVKTKVSDIIKLEVVAEDGATKILYDLMINVGDPYLTSGYYLVLQDRLLIDMFQANIMVSNFLNRVVPSSGSTLTVTDKLGNVRGPEGLMRKDDRVVVSDGTNTTVYHLKAMLDPYSDDATLADLMVNGTTVESFDPAVASYNVVLDQSQGMPDLPVVAGLPGYYSALVSIQQAVNLTGTTAERTATVTVKAEDGVTQAVYTIVFNLNVGVDPVESRLINIWANERTVCIRTNSLYQGDRVEIYNLAGRLILSRQLQTTYERIQITDQAGMYIVKVKTGEDVFVEKLILK